MSTPRRRSSRLRGSAATPGKSISYTPNRLGSLAEHEEDSSTPEQLTSIAAVLSTPQTPHTPVTAGRVKPSKEEMHPSKVQHSTTQKPDSGLRLGFTDVEAKGGDQPSGIMQQTPSKTGISDSTFQFTFARPGPQLGPDAQRMMDELREEALRIKARLAAEREEEIRRNGESAALDGRKIAQPKGKVGRFSDVHMAEFKKMDSIAGHPSAFRAQPGRFAPATNSLKRTQSKAQLDDRDDTQKPSEHHADKDIILDQLENAMPAKRARKRIADDTSSARPVSRGEAVKCLPATPTRPQTAIHLSIATPTKASLARAASMKKPVSQIPTLTRSPSKPNLHETPRRVTKSATANTISSIPRTSSKGFLHSPNKLDRVKSILRYPSNAKKPTLIPSLPTSPSKPNFEKPVPALPVTPGAKSVSKHVNFNTSNTVDKHSTMIQNSPSPMKTGIPRSTSATNPGAKNHGRANVPPKEVQYPLLGKEAFPDKVSSDIAYPSLAGVRPLPEPPRQFGSPSHNTAPAPSTFTFRSDHTINFGKSPKGFGSSPGQSSVRRVRPSFVPNEMPGSFPNKENTPPNPSIPHGMSNKKRRRVEFDDDESEEAQRLPKKHKAAEGGMLMAPKFQGPNETPISPTKTTSPIKKKGVLSLSRLNMLAKPKLRK